VIKAATATGCWLAEFHRQILSAGATDLPFDEKYSSPLGLCAFA
jgi:hypothetical protein